MFNVEKLLLFTIGELINSKANMSFSCSALKLFRAILQTTLCLVPRLPSLFCCGAHGVVGPVCILPMMPCTPSFSTQYWQHYWSIILLIAMNRSFISGSPTSRHSPPGCPVRYKWGFCRRSFLARGRRAWREHCDRVFRFPDNPGHWCGPSTQSRL